MRPMSEPDRLSKLRHDLANPLAALLAETQLLLMDGDKLASEVVASLKEIEAMAIRMRTVLREA